MYDHQLTVWYVGMMWTLESSLKTSESSPPIEFDPWSVPFVLHANHLPLCRELFPGGEHVFCELVMQNSVPDFAIACNGTSLGGLTHHFRQFLEPTGTLYHDSY